MQDKTIITYKKSLDVIIIVHRPTVYSEPTKKVYVLHRAWDQVLRPRGSPFGLLTSFKLAAFLRLLRKRFKISTVYFF